MSTYVGARNVADITPVHGISSQNIDQALVERSARLEDAQLWPCVLLGILLDRLKPAGRPRVFHASPPRSHLRFGIVGAAERGEERRLGEAKLVADGSGPYRPAAARSNAAPPEVTGSAFPPGLVEPREDLVLPDLHQAVGSGVPAFRASALRTLSSTLGFDALGHHLLVFLQVAAFLGGILGWQPRGPGSGEDRLLLLGNGKRVDHDVGAAEGRELGQGGLDPRLALGIR